MQYQSYVTLKPENKKRKDEKKGKIYGVCLLKKKIHWNGRNYMNYNEKEGKGVIPRFLNTRAKRRKHNARRKEDRPCAA